VNALITAAADNKANGEVFFATGDEHYSVAKIAKTITKYIGLGQARFVPWPKDRKATEVGDAVITNKKISNKLGWHPQVDFASGLIKTKQYYQPCLDKYLR